MTTLLVLVALVLLIALVLAVKEILYWKDVAEAQLREITWYKDEIEAAQNVDRLRSEVSRRHRQKAKLGL